jgi:hypothetical protein
MQNVAIGILYMIFFMFPDMLLFMFTEMQVGFCFYDPLGFVISEVYLSTSTDAIYHIL